jgi:hypothetical protein
LVFCSKQNNKVISFFIDNCSCLIWNQMIFFDVVDIPPTHVVMEFQEDFHQSW